MTLPRRISPKVPNRRSFIGGSDARVITGSDKAALLRLWREKRGGPSLRTSPVSSSSSLAW